MVIRHPVKVRVNLSKLKVRQSVGFSHGRTAERTAQAQRASVFCSVRSADGNRFEYISGTCFCAPLKRRTHGWPNRRVSRIPWLPDGYRQIFRSYVFGLSDFWTRFLDCAPTPSTLAQSKERKGSNFTIWQP